MATSPENPRQRSEIVRYSVTEIRNANFEELILEAMKQRKTGSLTLNMSEGVVCSVEFKQKTGD